MKVIVCSLLLVSSWCLGQTKKSIREDAMSLQSHLNTVFIEMNNDSLTPATTAQLLATLIKFEKTIQKMEDRFLFPRRKFVVRVKEVWVLSDQVHKLLPWIKDRNCNVPTIKTSSLSWVDLFAHIVRGQPDTMQLLPVSPPPIAPIKRTATRTELYARVDSLEAVTRKQALNYTTASYALEKHFLFQQMKMDAMLLRMKELENMQTTLMDSLIDALDCLQQQKIAEERKRYALQCLTQAQVAVARLR